MVAFLCIYDNYDKIIVKSIFLQSIHSISVLIQRTCLRRVSVFDKSSRTDSPVYHK